MKSKVVDVRLLGIGCILLSNALSSAAVTLGRHSGEAIIGRPLDIRVQATLAPGEDPALQCIGADVFFGDAPVPAGLVRSMPSSSGAGADAQVRIQSLQPINEPIVTVDVRAGCTAPFTRRYVLLADPLMEPLAPQRVVPLPVVPNSAANGPTPPADDRASSPAQAPAAPRVQTARAVTQQRTDPPEPPTVTRRAASPATAREPAPAVRDRTPRLQLDPLALELLVERDPVLKLSMDLLSEPTSEEARAAAGLLWQALSASPDERWRDVQRLAALEGEAQTLRGQTAQVNATIADLNGRLAGAESERYLNGVTYALGLGLLLALAALAVLWRRLASSHGSDAGTAWWKAAATTKTFKRKQDERTVLAPLDLDLTLDADSAFGGSTALSRSHEAQDSLPPSEKPLPSLSRRDRRDFVPSLIGAARSMATEELFDIQQQAEFFMSLGDDDQAIKVLRSHLADSAEPSALAYLDLLMLYHRLGRRDEYELARAEFNQMFNAGAPPFDQYSDQSKGLEAYETAFGRIQALWPDPRVLDVIEESIFRDPGNMATEVFDLEAYRELLLLHAMAKDMIKREVAPAKPAMDFQHTNIQPLKAVAKVGAAGLAGALVGTASSAQERAPAPADGGTEVPSDDLPPLPPVALDVDLSDLSSFSMFEALVLLHSMAKDMIQHEQPASELENDLQHTNVPLLNTEDEGAAGEVVGELSGDAPFALDIAFTAPGVESFDVGVAAADQEGLDLDLSDSSDFSLFDASLPELPAPTEQTAQARPTKEETSNHLDNLIDFDMSDLLMPDDPWSSERSKRTPGA